MPSVEVRLFASLRDLARASSVRVEAGSVGEMVEALAARFGQRFGQVAATGTVVVDGEPASSEQPLTGGEEVALLPPFSGGAPTRRPLRYS